MFVPAYDLLKKYKHMRYNLLVYTPNTLLFQSFQYFSPKIVQVITLLLYISLVECQKRSDVQAMKFIYVGLENFKLDVYVPTCDLLKKIQAHVAIYLFTHQIHCCFSHVSPKIAQVITTVHITRGVPQKV